MSMQQQHHQEEERNNNKFWINDFLRNFSGDFDNYNQVLQDYENGFLPKEGGGHEHFHCTLVPVSPISQIQQQQQPEKYGRLAAFYFDATPQSIFRFRYYELEPNEDSTILILKLYILSSDLETKLRQSSMNPMEWPQLFHQYIMDNNANNHSIVQHLPNCDIAWSTKPDPEQHGYAIQRQAQLDHDYALQQQQQDNATTTASNNDNNNVGFHAVMVNGQAIVDSKLFRPGQDILIRDQLSLWQNEFWIHDRGFNPQTMQYIYGNQRDVPYQLQRVATLQPQQQLDNNNATKSNDEHTAMSFKRIVVNPDLAWTMGSQYYNESTTTTTLYETKMKAIQPMRTLIRRQQQQKQQETQSKEGEVSSKTNAKGGIGTTITSKA